MRIATVEDINYIANSLIELSLFLKERGDNIYIQGLPSEVDEMTLKIASNFVVPKNSCSFIEEFNGEKVGVICVSIKDSSFPVSGLGKIGFIEACFVDEKFRQEGLASKFLFEAESWVKSRGINTLELSYLVENTLARKSWQKMGFQDFRTFSYKNI